MVLRDTESKRKLIYKERKGPFQFDYYWGLVAIPIIIFSIVLFNILFYDTLMQEASGNPDSLMKNIAIVVIINVIVASGVWLMWYQVRCRAQFRLYEDGFIPPRIPKNRRRPKEKHFITIDEIEKLELVLLKEEPYWGNYVLATLKDGTQFHVLEKHVERRGLEKLMKFKEMHGL